MARALHTFLALWHAACLKKRRVVKLTTAVLDLLGVSRSAKARALKVLEDAGLVRVERRDRRNPLVEILYGKGAPSRA
jgi:DNA-binding transcriptional ArsR family regulator